MFSWSGLAPLKMQSQLLNEALDVSSEDLHFHFVLMFTFIVLHAVRLLQLA
jgi:hypothetical protein